MIVYISLWNILWLIVKQVFDSVFDWTRPGFYYPQVHLSLSGCSVDEGSQGAWSVKESSANTEDPLPQWTRPNVLKLV